MNIEHEFERPYLAPVALHDSVIDVMEELSNARVNYPDFASAHEGLAILWEEFEELKAEIFLSPKKRDVCRMRAEAVQVAAMALRFIDDVCDQDDYM